MKSVARRFGSTVAVAAGLAAVTLALALCGAPAPLVAAAAVVALVAVMVQSGRRPRPVLASIGVVVAIAVVVELVDLAQAGIGAVLAGVLVAVAGLLDPMLGERIRPRVRARNLPGVSDTPVQGSPYIRPLAVAGLALVVGLLVVWVARLLTSDAVRVIGEVVGVAVLLVTVGLLVRATLGLRAAVRDRRHGTVDDAVVAALDDHRPEFAIYHSGSGAGAYQVRMWVEPLLATGKSFVVVVRDEQLLDLLGDIGVPVLATPELAGLERVLVRSIRAVFYVNTDPGCVDGVRHLDRTHVHLNHGDSDKPASYHPMIAMFDQVFVAGQAAIDRFADHGVQIPAEKFVIVGRPQIADLADHNTTPVPGHPTVLYAPTWRGGVKEMAFSSLPAGEALVQGLLDRGARVIFRPHPLSHRDAASVAAVARIDARLRAAPGKAGHLTSDQVMDADVFGLFDLSDILLTDVSSLATDYLATGKPLGVVDVGGAGELPVQRAAVRVLAADPAEGIERLLTGDDLATVRRELRTHYLGSVPPGRRDTRFVDAALRAIDS